jgi:hypothetical protein
MSTAISSASKLKPSAVEVRGSTIDKAGKGLFTKRDFDGGEEIWSQKRPLVAVLDDVSLPLACSNCFSQVHDVTSSWKEDEKPVEVKACTQCKLLRFCSKVCYDRNQNK